MSLGLHVQHGLWPTRLQMGQHHAPEHHSYSYRKHVSKRSVHGKQTQVSSLNATADRHGPKTFCLPRVGIDCHGLIAWPHCS